MKLHCDVCGIEAASVICYADEAALCRSCDNSVHSANKLAGKHRRASLLHHSKTLPLCDICKERRGFVFCQEDRAILCKDCDLPIHSANSNAGKHTRFLLSGIRLSAAPISSAASSSSSPLTSETEMVSTCFSATSCRASEEDTVCSRHTAAGGGSTISDYLMNTLPGWRVDDFLFDEAGDAGDLISCHSLSEQAVETEAAAGGGVAWTWPGCAVAKMEDKQACMTPFPAVPANVMAQEEVSMVTQFQYQNTSKKRSMASFWY